MCTDRAIARVCSFKSLRFQPEAADCRQSSGLVDDAATICGSGPELSRLPICFSLARLGGVGFLIRCARDDPFAAPPAAYGLGENLEGYRQLVTASDSAWPGRLRLEDLSFEASLQFSKPGGKFRCDREGTPLDRFDVATAVAEHPREPLGAQLLVLSPHLDRASTHETHQDALSRNLTVARRFPNPFLLTSQSGC